MEYCDLIAHLVVKGLKTHESDQGIGFFAVKRKLDLDPEDGSFRSTDKFITCSDNRGNKYKITVESV